MQGRNRHVIVDCLGPLLVVLVTTASVQGRDGARPALEPLHHCYEKITLIWADGPVRAGPAGAALIDASFGLALVRAYGCRAGFLSTSVRAEMLWLPWPA